jgi:hypothetical protein
MMNRLGCPLTHPNVLSVFGAIGANSPHPHSQNILLFYREMRPRDLQNTPRPLAVQHNFDLLCGGWLDAPCPALGGVLCLSCHQPGLASLGLEAVTRTVPAMVRFVRQSGHHADCGVATLAMLAGVLYEDALAATLCAQPSVLQLGLTWSELRKAATALGVKTRLLRKYDLEEATGILNVVKAHDDEHFVLVWEGRIVDGNGELWRDPADYLSHYGYQPRALLTAVDG